VIFIKIRIVSSNGEVCGFAISPDSKDFFNDLCLYASLIGKKILLCIEDDLLVVRCGSSTSYFFEIPADLADILKEKAEDYKFTIMDTIIGKGTVLVSPYDLAIVELGTPLKESSFAPNKERGLFII
jgi:hypothetical protein